MNVTAMAKRTLQFQMDEASKGLARGNLAIYWSRQHRGLVSGVVQDQLGRIVAAELDAVLHPPHPVNAVEVGWSLNTTCPVSFPLNGLQGPSLPSCVTAVDALIAPVTATDTAMFRARNWQTGDVFGGLYRSADTWVRSGSEIWPMVRIGSLQNAEGYSYEIDPALHPALARAVRLARALDPLHMPHRWPYEPVKWPYEMLPYRVLNPNRSIWEQTHRGPVVQNLQAVAPAVKPAIGAAGRPKPPPKGVHERKVKLSPAASAVVSTVTEVVDFVHALYGALPRHLRVKGATVNEKILALFKHYREIDVPKAFQRVIIQQAEDVLYGLIGKPNKYVNRQLFDVTGSQMAGIGTLTGGVRRSTAQMPKPSDVISAGMDALAKEILK